MKFFNHFILLFISIFTLFINPIASSRVTNVTWPLSTKHSSISTVALDGVKIPTTPNIVVSQDGKGKYQKIMDAIAAAPKGLSSNNYFVILVKKGVYKEYVEIDESRTNIVLMGEGKDATVISGSKSASGGVPTFDSATFAVRAQGFVAMNIGFENTAGPKAGQAVAVKSSGDRTAFYRCKFTGNQDTLLVQSGRQFFRECFISGTVDFIFGYATAVFQKCNIFIKNSQASTSVIADHGRNSSSDPSGFALQYCTVTGDSTSPNEDAVFPPGVFLGRGWGVYARTVFIQSSISGIVAAEGWLQAKGEVDKLYFGEYGNSGAGAALGGRVKWPGFHKMTAAEADQFTVAKFIDGNSWIPSLGIPYVMGLDLSAEAPMGAQNL